MKTNNVDTTRAVEKLISYKQAIVDDGRIVLTPLGRCIAELIEHDQIANPARVAEWEYRAGVLLPG
jgi:hypothetical protein